MNRKSSAPGPSDGVTGHSWAATVVVVHGGRPVLTGTCRHHDIDPFAYLQDVLGRLPFVPKGQSPRPAPSPTYRTSSVACRRHPRISSVRSARRLVRVAPLGTAQESRVNWQAGCRIGSDQSGRTAIRSPKLSFLQQFGVSVLLLFHTLRNAARSCRRSGTARLRAHAFDRRGQVSHSVHSVPSVGISWSALT